jgi:4-amino-4-deoxy-L-arabinose transferase-like glycosyltransferase
LINVSSDNQKDIHSKLISQKLGLFLLFLIFLIALIARLDLVGKHHLPFGDNDGMNLEIAKNLTQYKGFISARKWLYFKSEPDSIFHNIHNRQPLVIVLLAEAFLITGVSFYAGKILLLIIGLFSLWMVYKLSLLWFSKDIAILSTFIIAINPTQIWFSSSIDDQMLFQLILFVIIFFYYKYELSSRELNFKDSYILGCWIGLSYLSRNNGLLVMSAFGLDLIFRFISPKFWKKLVICGIAVWLGFLTSSGWWLARNYQAFGNPFFTRNSIFLYNDNMFESVWKVREEPPSPGDFFKTHSFSDIVKREIQGFYRIVEPFIMGNIFHNELFSQGNMTGFLLFAILLLPSFSNFRKHLFLILITLMHFFSFTAHQHVFRYLMPFYVILYILGTAGFVNTLKHILKTMNILGFELKSKSKILISFLIFFLILLFPFIRPLRTTFGFDDNQEFRATMDVVDWLKKNTRKGEIIMEYRFLERLIYMYDRPTLITPNDDFNTIIDTARHFHANYFILYKDLIQYRPGLSEKWYIQNGKICSTDIPEYLSLVYKDPSDSYLVYKFNWIKSKIPVSNKPS